MSEQSEESFGCPSPPRGEGTTTAGTNTSNAWVVSVSSGYVHNNNWNGWKDNARRVRAVSASDSEIYDIPFATIVDAFEKCCSGKGSTPDMLHFMAVHETELVALWRSIATGNYTPSVAYCFVTEWPVKREIFAAAYVDRVVHHWVISRIEQLLEAHFKAQGNVSKNCRKGQGCLSAVRDVAELIREETNNYHADAWIFKGDIYGFFMSIDQALLWEMIEIFVREYYQHDDLACLLYRKHPINYILTNNNRSNCQSWQLLRLLVFSSRCLSVVSSCEVAAVTICHRTLPSYMAYEL